MVEVRDEILKALEIARGEKLIRSSLEAGVEIYAEPELLLFISHNLEQIRVLSIVSHIGLLTEPPDALDFIHKSTELDGLVLRIIKAPGEKCERCWTYRISVGENPNHPTLCDRCVANLEERAF